MTMLKLLNSGNPTVEVDFTEWDTLDKTIKQVPEGKTSIFTPEAAILRILAWDNLTTLDWITHTMFAKGTTAKGSKVFIVANVPNYMSTHPIEVSEAYIKGRRAKNLDHSFTLNTEVIDALVARDGEKDESGSQRVTVIPAETLARYDRYAGLCWSKSRYDEHVVAIASFGSPELSAAYGDTYRAKFRNCSVDFDKRDNYDKATGLLAFVGSPGLCNGICFGGNLNNAGVLAIVAPETLKVIAGYAQMMCAKK